MQYSPDTITPDFLKSFVPIHELDDEKLEVLANSASIESVPSGTRIIERGAEDNWLFYLLEGDLKLEAADGNTDVISGGSDRANNPLAKLKPRQYNVTSMSPTRILKLNDAQFEQLLRGDLPEEGYSVLEMSTSFDDVESRLFMKLYQDVENDSVELPSLPEVAVHIRRLIEADNSSAESLAKVVQADSVITAKLLKAANSALYSGQAQVDSCAGAIVRLGTETTAQLVMSFAMGELFGDADESLNKRMKDLWEHSIEVAAISYVLAEKVKGFDCERALLAGLLHDVGVIAILTYASKYPEASENPRYIDRVIKDLRGQIGGMILEKWNFPVEFVNAARDAEDWERDSSTEADYCDLVMIAQLHGFISKPGLMNVPPLVSLPAFRRLGLGNMTPENGLAVINEAAEQIAEVKAMLSIQES